MSQEKVDKKKYEKTHRKELMKKEKRKKIITRSLITILLLALVGAYAYYMVQQKNKKDSDALTEEQLNSLIEELNASTTEAGNTEEE